MITAIIASGLSTVSHTPISADINRIKLAAKCAISRDRTGATAIASAFPGSERDLAALSRPKIAKCLSSAGISSEAEREQFGGEVAHSLYLSTTLAFWTGPRHGDPQVVAAIEARPYVASPVHSAKDAAMLATCLVVSSPNTADQIVRTPVGSDKEMRAISDAGPTLARCVDPHVSIAFYHAALRAEIDRAMYRYVNAPNSLWQ